MLHVTATASGHRATLDSLDQGAIAMAVDTITVTSTGIRFELSAIGAAYEGTYSDGGRQLSGSWSQRGRAWSLCWRHE